MGFLDDLKKTAADAQRAIERQVDKMQAEQPPAPQPPPVDGAAPSGSQEQPPATGASQATGTPEVTGPPSGLPQVATATDAPPASLPQPSTFPQPSNESQPLTPPGPLPAGPQIRAVEETLPGSSGQANANPLPPPEPRAH